MSPSSVREFITGLMNEETLVGKLVGEKKMRAMVQRLDRLTRDEARQTVAQIFKLVHGLIENMKVVMNGEQIYQACRVRVARWVLKIFPCRWRGIGRPS